jgi:hypothetical protein
MRADGAEPRTVASMNHDLQSHLTPLHAWRFALDGHHEPHVTTGPNRHVTPENVDVVLRQGKITQDTADFLLRELNDSRTDRFTCLSKIKVDLEFGNYGIQDVIAGQLTETQQGALQEHLRSLPDGSAADLPPDPKIHRGPRYRGLRVRNALHAAHAPLTLDAVPLVDRRAPYALGAPGAWLGAFDDTLLRVRNGHVTLGDMSSDTARVWRDPGQEFELWLFNCLRDDAFAVERAAAYGLFELADGGTSRVCGLLRRRFGRAVCGLPWF